MMTKESSIPETHTKGLRQRQITVDNFTALLVALGDTPQERGTQYETLRSKLIFFFSRRSLQFPEDLADEVLDRLAHRISDGIEIASPPAFALGIARHVAQEQSKKISHLQAVDETFWNNVPAHLTTQSEEEEIARMERCLKKLPRAEVRLLRGYYLAATDNPTQIRKNFAEDLGISPNTLRQRVFLALKSLRVCMTAVERKKRR
jgi:DNA-directed RNA polymerase specialized sigma24 family protein